MNEETERREKKKKLQGAGKRKKTALHDKEVLNRC
jgi:hypothetical protein